MLKPNSPLATSVSVGLPRYLLPRIKSLGSRLLNAVVILSLILPNITVAVQAAAPPRKVQLPREESVSQPSPEDTLAGENESDYQAPVFSHPQPRTREDLNSQKFQNKINEDQISKIIVPVENEEVQPSQLENPNHRRENLYLNQFSPGSIFPDPADPSLPFNSHIKGLKSPALDTSSHPPANPPYAPPSNDDFDSAIQVTTLPYNTQLDVSEGTTAVDDPVISCLGDTGTNSIWYEVVPSTSGLIKFDTSVDSSFDTVLAVWTGTRGNLTEVACSDDADGVYASVTQYVSSGTSYWVEIVSKEAPSIGLLSFDVDFVIEEVSGLRGAYYNNTDMTGDPTATRQDSTVDFSWGAGSPMAEIAVDGFSVLWTGSIEPEFNEDYIFHTLSDDGVRLWVDGELLIDNWTLHGPTWDNGVINLQAGVKYTIRLEYFESGGDATIRLEWSSASTTQEVIPASQLTTLDLSGSTVEADPVSDQSTTITVTTMTGGGSPTPVSDQQIYIQISGTNNSINGVPVLDGEWFDIGKTDSGGVVTAGLSSPENEYKLVQARTGSTPIPDTEVIDFWSVGVNRFLILLYGETHLPGSSSPQKTGSPEPIYTGEPTTFEILAIDSDNNIVTEFNWPVDITANAEVPASVILEDGVATVNISWNVSGFNLIAVTIQLPPGQTEPEIWGFGVATVEDSLTVEDGEVLYVDDDRYAVDEVLSSGTTTIPYNGTARILPGHQLLIATMLGSGIGDYEIHEVASVGTDSLEVSSPLVNDYNGAGDSVIVQRVPLYPNVEIQSGGKITARTWNGITGGIVAFEVDPAGQLMVESGGEITVNGLGFRSGAGPGAGTSAGLGQGAGGGGHGGHGGNSTGSGGIFYDNLSSPFALGSAGGNKGKPGGAGGGIVYLDAQNITINGTITASGTQGQEDYGGSGGGAGGSVQLHTSTLDGSGIIRANGGAGGVSGWYADGGGGGGGRVYLSDDFSGAVQVFGGSGQQYGGAGTIVHDFPLPSHDQLVINNNGHNGNYAGIIEDDVSSLGDYSILLNNFGHLRAAGSESSFTVDNNTLNGDGSAVLAVEGTLTGPAVFVIDGITISVEGVLEDVQDLTVGAGGGLILRAYTDLYFGLYIFGNVTVQSDGKLRLIPEGNVPGYGGYLPFNLHVDNLSVETGGAISTDTSGYISNMGPGAGTSAPNNGQGAGGAGFGGAGGDSTYAGGAVYGDLYLPYNLGSGGGSRNVAGGRGGGSIVIAITDTLTLNGIISADGGNGRESYGGSGGGSGGSIRIHAETFTGTGTLRAKGGNGAVSGLFPDGGGGGGGRIAVYAEQDTFTGNVLVTGGSGENYGDEGTKYFDNIDPLLSTISITPPEVTADGITEGTITVTLLDKGGSPLAGELVKVALDSGGDAYLNGQERSVGQYIQIDPTNASGQAIATIAASSTGTRTVKARGGDRDVFIQDLGLVDFIPGPVNEGTSTVTASVNEAPADGVTEVSILVTARDAQGHPIPDLPVTLSATGSAVVTQPAAPTNSQGETSGSVRNAVIETVLISAAVDGISLGDQATVQFSGADPAVTLSAPGEAMAGAEVIQTIQVNNLGNTTANDVTLVLDLPAELIFLSHTALVEPTQDGNSYTWLLGSLNAGEQVEFAVTVQIEGSTPEGTDLTSTLTVSTSSDGDDPGNNSSQTTTSVGEFYNFTSSMDPGSATLRLGGEAEFVVHLQNSGFLADSYDLSVTGLDPSWISFSSNPATIPAGGIAEVILSVEPTGCPSEDTLPFQVSITSDGDGQTRVHTADLILDQDPLIYIDAPNAGATSGSRSVNFSWRTNPATTGILSIYPQGSPGETQTFNTAEGRYHSLEVADLTRYQTYVWSVDVTSTCGTAASPDRLLTIGSGIVFTNHNQNLTINRDYDQRVNITVRNEDSLEHTLTSTVLNPYDDLILNFVDSGSMDETITLQPGASAQLTLAVHAQDAAQTEYTLTAHLTADEGTGTPIEDQASINLTVLSENNYSIQAGSLDPVTLGREYTITNNGYTITDLNINATKPGSDEPASVYITPNVTHARLGTGESLAVTLYPIFTDEDLAQASISSGTHLAAIPSGVVSIDYDLHATTGTGGDQTVSDSTECGSGKDLYTVTFAGCNFVFNNNSWYCTNRPEISTPLMMPYFLDDGVITSLELGMSFSPHNNVEPHNGQISLNGTQVGEFSDTIPEGSFSFDVPISLLNTSVAGMVSQNVQISTQHPNPGHYVSNTGNLLRVGISEVSFPVCAETQEQAQIIAEVQYPCQAGSGFNWLTDIFDPSVVNNSTCDDPLACGASTAKGASVGVGDPINSRTGTFSYTNVDLSLPSSAGRLLFQRAYSTGTLDGSLDVMGSGWTHNHDARLIFPSDTDGMEDFVLFQGVVGNRYLFHIETDGSYTSGPGVTASLVENTGPPLTYTVRTADQTELVFDEFGTLISRTDPEGHGFTYSYDLDGKLTQISADGGPRFFTLTYDGDGRIISVSDYSGRAVSYTYDASGDLVSYTDLLGQDWSYNYDSAHRITEVVDPRLINVVRTEYDLQGRAFRQYDGEDNLLTEVVYHPDGSSTVYDSMGNSETHQHDDRNTLVNQTDPQGGSIIKTYDDQFRPKTITNQAGNTTQLTWSADGAKLTEVEDANGGQTQLGYDTLNNLTEITDAHGNLTSYAYSGTLMTSSTDVFGETTSYSYTPEGWVSSATDPLGHTTYYAYDANGQVTSLTDALGNTTSYLYDDLGRMVSFTDPLGRTTLNQYDPAGRMVKVTHNYDAGRPQNDQDLYNIVIEYEYDQVGNLKGVTDTYGHTTQFSYDNNNRLVRITDSKGNATTHAYDSIGNQVSTTDPKGRVTHFGYDSLNRLVSTTDPLGNTTVTTYNLDGTVASTTNPHGSTTYYSYDDLQRVVAVTDPLGNTTTTSYDALGNVISTTDSLGRTTNYTYDALGRLIRITDPAGSVTEHFYNELGNWVQTVNPKGNPTTYTYDVLGRLVSITNAQGGTTSFTYNAVGQRISVTDPLGMTTNYNYDALGRQVSITDALGHTSSTAYDALGRATASTDPLGRTTSSSYDTLGHLISQSDPAGGVVQYTYDSVGNLLSMTDPNGHTRATGYDSLNRPVSVIDPNGNGSTTSYDALGNIISSTNALGETTHFSYDALGRQVGQTDPLGNTTQFIYDAVGNRRAVVDAKGISTRFEYDSLNRLVAVVENYRPGFTPTNDIHVRTEYSYDQLGNRLTIKDARNNITSFSYNSLNWLISETDPLGNTWTHSYDARGSRISSTDANGVTTYFRYDALGRQIAIDYPGTSEDVSFDYSAVGQPVSMADGVGTTSWTYDSLGRTTSVNDPFGDTVSYSYDPAGNRTQLVYPDGKAVSYAYDPANRLTQVTDWESYVTGYNYNAANQLTAVSLPNGVTSTYDYDAGGQLTSLTHETAVETLSSFQYSYDPVGNRISAVESLVEPEEPPVTDHYFSDDMDAGADNWTAEGDWALVEDTPGDFVWSLNPTDDYQRNTDYSLTLNIPVTIPAEAIRPELSFYDPLSAGSNSSFQVEISPDDGATWEALITFTSVDNRSDWILRRAALDDYLGQTIQLRFRAVQGSAWFSDTWTLDDLRIGDREAPPDLGFPFEDPVDSLENDHWQLEGQWTVVDTGGYNDDFAWSLNPAEGYQRNTDFALELAGSIVIPEDSLRPELAYHDLLEIASNTTLFVETTIDDGLTWEVLTQFDSSFNRGDWALRKISLDGYQGETLRFRFRAVQGSAWTRDIWLLDGIQVEEHEAAPDLVYPFIDDLESGTDNWEFSGQWLAVDTDSHSEVYSLSLNPENEYQRNTDFSVELVGMIPIPTDAVRPELSYFDRLNIASNTTLSVEVTVDDGLTWETVTAFTSAYNRPADPDQDWNFRRIPLDAYLGQTIRLRFRALQGSAWVRDLWLIDDIRVGDHEVPPDLGFPYQEGFEGGLVDWQPDGQWAIVTADVYSGLSALDMNPADEYQRNTDFAVELSGTVTIPLEVTLPELRYYDHFEIASNTTLTVEITADDGLSWTVLDTFNSSENRPDWVLRVISLDGYQGETVRVRLRAVQGSAWKKDHWYLDDLTLGEHQAPPLGNFPFADSLEDGTENWLIGGQWALVEVDSHSPTHTWDINPDNGYQRNTDFSLELAAAIQIPANANRPELSYYDHFLAGSNTTLSVEVTIDDGQTWETAATFNASQNRTDWILRRIPLDLYKGMSIRIRFRAVQGSAWYKDHWYLDDIRIGERQDPVDLTYPFFDDLESGAGNWEFGGQWALSDVDAFSPENALDLNPGNGYQRNTDFAVELSGEINVPADASRPELSYYDHLNIASNTTLTIEITTDDGQSWETAAAFKSSQNRPDWINRRVSLESYKGQSIRIRFHAVQGSAWFRDVWRVDDIRVGDHETPPALAYPFFDDLESGASNWEFGGQWSLATGDAYSPDYALDLNPGNGYQRNTDFAVELDGEITIPVNAERPELSYYDHLNIASNTTLKIEITTDDGLSWNELTQYKAASNRSDWILRRVSFEGYQGQTIRLRFRAVQGSAWTRDIWRLDGLRLGDRETQTLAFPFVDLVSSLDLADWEPDGQWAVVDTGGSNDDYTWSLNPGEAYQRNTDFALTLGGEIELPAETEGLILSYQDHFTLANNTSLFLEISTDDAQTWTVLESFSRADDTAEWTLREISLDAYAGESVWIRFRADQGSAWTRDVWEVDELRVDQLMLGLMALPGDNTLPTPTETPTPEATPTFTPSYTSTETPVGTPPPPDTATYTPGPLTDTPTETLVESPPPPPTATYTPGSPTDTPTETPVESPPPPPTATFTPEPPTETPTETPEGSSLHYPSGSGALAAPKQPALEPAYLPDNSGSSLSASILGLPSAVPFGGETNRTISYSYDPLNRLVAADYDDGTYFHYTYDAVGNRLTQDTLVGTNAYSYDAANRLIDVDGQPYSWDNNGNLLSDGTRVYSYNYANMLVAVSMDGVNYTYAYNGMGDRLRQNVDGQITNYTLDINRNLSQVLVDDSNTYLYGLGRIAQQAGGDWDYFLVDALSSVRQLSNSSASLSLVQSYQPYGETLSNIGDGNTPYGYTGEWKDPTGFIHLRARYYDPMYGRFFQPDPMEGHSYQPASFNPYGYALNNPNIYIDPSGRVAITAAALLSAMGSGFLIGAGIGTTLGSLDYGWALAGDCGCDMQQQAFQMGFWKWVGMHALVGGIAGGLSPIIALAAAAAPLGAILVGGTTAVLSGIDLYHTYQIIKNETGWTWCTGIRVVMDIAGIIFGSAGVIKGVQAWRKSGNILRWLPPENPTTGTVGVDDAPKRWKIGDPIDAPTKNGDPSWNTVRSRYWKNKAYNSLPGDYTPENLVRMKKGLAPLHKIFNVPKELHHIGGRSIEDANNISNLLEVWPWEHAKIDNFRFYSGPQPGP